MDRDVNGGPVSRNWLCQWFQTLNLSVTCFFGGEYICVCVTPKICHVLQCSNCTSFLFYPELTKYHTIFRVFSNIIHHLIKQLYNTRLAQRFNETLCMYYLWPWHWHSDSVALVRIKTKCNAQKSLYSSIRVVLVAWYWKPAAANGTRVWRAVPYYINFPEVNLSWIHISFLSHSLYIMSRTVRVTNSSNARQRLICRWHFPGNGLEVIHVSQDQCMVQVILYI